MKDASHALNSGLAFSSSSRKCQVFKMIYCHAVGWGRRATWKWSEGRLCWVPAGHLRPSRGRLWDHGQAKRLLWASVSIPYNGGKTKMFLKGLCKGV